MRNRILSLILALLMCFSILSPANASSPKFQSYDTSDKAETVENITALSGSGNTYFGTFTNLRGTKSLRDVVGVKKNNTYDSLVGVTKSAAESEDEAAIKKAGLGLRQVLVARKANYVTTIVLNDKTMTKAVLLDAILKSATEETGKGYEGDYLAYHWNQFSYSLTPKKYGAQYKWYFDMDITYWNSAEEENKLNSTLPSLYAKLGLSSKSPYDKIKTIYDYVISHVTYDYAHVNMGAGYPLQFSAYAALCKGIAVCQGYSLLMYRMLLDNGISARCICGTSHGESHMWNIIGIDGAFYNADATWDSANKTHKYFLKGSSFNAEHQRDDAWKTSEFATSTTDYVRRADTTPSTQEKEPELTVAQIKAPAGIKVVVNDGIPEITWTASEHGKKYTVYRKGENDERGTPIVTTTATYYRDKNAPYGVYIYFVMPCTYTENGLTYKANSTSPAVLFAKVQTMLAPTMSQKGLIKWKAVDGVSGYEIRIRRGSAYARVNASGNAKSKKVKIGKGTYYMSIRAYITGGEKNYLGAWSSERKVIIR